MKKTALEFRIRAAGWKMFGRIDLGNFLPAPGFCGQLTVVTRHGAGSETLLAPQPLESWVVLVLSPSVLFAGRACAGALEVQAAVSSIACIIGGVGGVVDGALPKCAGNNRKSECGNEGKDQQFTHRN